MNQLLINKFIVNSIWSTYWLDESLQNSFVLAFDFNLEHTSHAWIKSNLTNNQELRINDNKFTLLKLRYVPERFKVWNFLLGIILSELSQIVTPLIEKEMFTEVAHKFLYSKIDIFIRKLESRFIFRSWKGLPGWSEVIDLQRLQKVCYWNHKVFNLALIFVFIMLIVRRINFNDSEFQDILATSWG